MSGSPRIPSRIAVLCTQMCIEEALVLLPLEAVFHLRLKLQSRVVKRIDVGVVFAANSQGFCKLLDTFAMLGLKVTNLISTWSSQ